MIDGRPDVENLLNSDQFFDNSLSAETQQNTSLLAIENKTKSTPSTSDYLVAFSTQSQSYCVGYVDIVNSTHVSASLPPAKLSLYYEIFLNSMSKIIGKLGGKVIKNIGDCLLYYFPSSINSGEDGLVNCLDCGLAMLNARKLISQEMISQGLPKINYRVSADYGAVILMNTSNSQAIDLIGPPVNMCAKINHCAGHNEFVIGSDFHQYAKKFPDYEFDEIKSCDVGFRYSYPVYRVSSRFSNQ